MSCILTNWMDGYPCEVRLLWPYSCLSNIAEYIILFSMSYPHLCPLLSLISINMRCETNIPYVGKYSNKTCLLLRIGEILRMMMYHTKQQNTIWYYQIALVVIAITNKSFKSTVRNELCYHKIETHSKFWKGTEETW